MTEFWNMGSELKEFCLGRESSITVRRQFMLTSSYGVTLVSSVIDGVAAGGQRRQVEVFWDRWPMTAICFIYPNTHSPPASGCDCGFHGIKPNWRTINVGVKEGVGKVVFGEIALWGRVVEHEGGYRGQYAQLLSIEEG